jgi:GalNAc-alpha-(1->4)-GalNAc-alpha-(1->3)-diNAcBac-PP-undecaprenol alpha-1,4-N-acetyl-D-galactosaminyltransferase
LKKIIFVLPELSGGGVQRVVSLLSLEFVKLGYDVKIVLLVDKIEYEYGGELIILNSQPNSNYIKKIFILLDRARSLKKIFKKEKADRIYAFMESCTYPSILTGEEIIVSVRNNIDVRLSYFQKRILSFFYKCKNVKKVIAVSKEIEKKLKELGIQKTTTIYNPLNFNIIDNMEDLTKYKPYFLSVGRLDKIKNFEMLIKSYNNTKSKGVVKLLIAGEGNERSNLENLIMQLKLNDKVFLIGRKENINDYYSQADIYILSSKSEGFPNVIVEALMNKCPVISTDCPTGPNEIIINNKNGLLIKNENQEEMTKTIDSLYFNKKQKEYFRGNALDSVLHLNGKKIAMKWLSV